MSDLPEQDSSPLEPDNDYDGAWKEALRQHFDEFLRDYFPAAHALIDWRVKPEWLDKEITQVLAQPGQRSRFVDLLANVRLLSGEEQWILLHVEVQTAFEEGFEFRLACYNAGLLSAFRRRVVTLVILADLRDNWLPEEDSFQFADFSSRLRFSVCKLIHRLETDWQGGTSLPIQLARAQIAALRTARHPERRLESKWKLVRSLYEMGYDADGLRRVFRWIDRMLQLRGDLEQLFTIRLTEFEEERSMPYVTSVERVQLARAEAQGEARGEARGIAAGASSA
ncbi:MAG TPA: hypothetical protein VK137_06555, partial [Planctomycetaceae bacterium]|nr:hypothetical protein [Planctomycetaceae bacterium]